MIGTEGEEAAAAVETSIRLFCDDDDGGSGLFSLVSLICLMMM